MRRLHFFLILTALVALTASAARGEQATYAYSDGYYDTEFIAVDYDAEIPQELRDALDRAGFGEWRVLDCVAGARTLRRGEEQWESKSAMAAVEKDGVLLLLSGTRYRQTEWLAWQFTPASDSFLPAGEPVDMRMLPLRDARSGEITQVLPVICRGQDQYFLSGQNLYAYRHEDGPGAGVEIRLPGDGAATATVWRGGSVQEIYSASYLYPRALEYWRLADVPRSVSELKAFEAAHPFPSEQTFGIARGGHFRAEASSASASLGEFVAAPVRIQATKQGSQDPWYRVTVGNLEGWVSFPYLNPEHWDASNATDDWAGVQPVAVLQADTPLCREPSGEAQAALPAGKMTRLLLFQGDWLYVEAPLGDVSWTFDSNSLYGWVPRSAVKTYATPLQARYQAPEAKLYSDY